MALVSARSLNAVFFIDEPINRTAGVPQVHHFGQEGLHNVLVIDLLGPNLEDLFDMCGRKFTIKTVCMAAKQMVCNVPCLSVHRCFLKACMPCSEL